MVSTEGETFLPFGGRNKLWWGFEKEDRDGSKMTLQPLFEWFWWVSWKGVEWRNVKEEVERELGASSHSSWPLCRFAPICLVLRPPLLRTLPEGPYTEKFSPWEFGVSLPIHFLSLLFFSPFPSLSLAISNRGFLSLLLVLPTVTRQVPCVQIPIAVKTAWAEVPVAQTP